MTRILTILAVLTFVVTAFAQVPEGAQLCQAPAVTTKTPVQHVPILRALTPDEEGAIRTYLDQHPGLGTEREVTETALRFLTAIGQSHYPLTRHPYEYAVDYQIFTQMMGRVDWYVNMPAEREWPEFTPVGPAPPIVPLELTPLCPPGPELVPVTVGETPSLMVHTRTALELKDANRPCTNLLVAVKDRTLDEMTIFGANEPSKLEALPEICEAPAPICQSVVLPQQQNGVRPLGVASENNPEVSKSNLDLLVYWGIARSLHKTCEKKPTDCGPGTAPNPPPVGNTTAPTTVPPLGNGAGWGGSNQPPAQRVPAGVDGHSWEPKPSPAE